MANGRLGRSPKAKAFGAGPQKDRPAALKTPNTVRPGVGDAGDAGCVAPRTARALGVGGGRSDVDPRDATDAGLRLFSHICPVCDFLESGVPGVPSVHGVKPLPA